MVLAVEEDVAEEVVEVEVEEEVSTIFIIFCSCLFCH